MLILKITISFTSILYFSSPARYILAILLSILSDILLPFSLIQFQNKPKDLDCKTRFYYSDSPISCSIFMLLNVQNTYFLNKLVLF